MIGNFLTSMNISLLPRDILAAFTRYSDFFLRAAQRVFMVSRALRTAGHA